MWVLREMGIILPGTCLRVSITISSGHEGFIPLDSTEAVSTVGEDVALTGRVMDFGSRFFVPDNGQMWVLSVEMP